MTWNGYGLSFWRCRCGAARRFVGAQVRHDCIAEVYAAPCKRCGTHEPPAVWPDDPWLYLKETGA